MALLQSGVFHSRAIGCARNAITSFVATDGMVSTRTGAQSMNGSCPIKSSGRRSVVGTASSEMIPDDFKVQTPKKIPRSVAKIEAGTVIGSSVPNLGRVRSTQAFAVQACPRRASY